MNLKLTPLAIATASLISVSAHSSPSVVRIIGGTESTPDTYPWMVSLQSKDGEHFCGASLIDKQWVLTAAHCVNEDSANDIQVVVGEYDLNTNDTAQQARDVSEIHYHKEYGDDHDIAILKLASPVTNSPVSVATPELMAELAAGTHLRVMGWGNRSTDGEDFPNILHEVTVPLADHATCKTNYQPEGIEITDNMVCAGFADGGKDSCQGDSGGPLLVQKDNQWFQAGIVSFGVGCAQANFFGVYTKASNYLSWIEAEKESAPSEPSDPTDPIDPTDPTDPSEPDFPDDTVENYGLPEFIDFFAFGDETASDYLFVFNTDEQAISIENFHMSNDAFAISENECGSTLESMEDCIVDIDFTSDTDGTEFGYLTVTIDSQDYKTALIGFSLGLMTGDTDYDDMDWYQEPDEPWSDIDDELGFELDCSGVSNDDNVPIATDFEGPGTLEFDFTLEGDEDGNTLEYSVDGVVVKSITSRSSGSNRFSTQISEGKHRVSWTYKKSTANTSGAKAKVSNVTFKSGTSGSSNADNSASGGSSGGSGGSQTPWFLLSLAALLGLRRYKR